jgi:hypothetical protein
MTFACNTKKTAENCRKENEKGRRTAKWRRKR